MTMRARHYGYLPPASLVVQAGLTLIELMISLALGMLVVAAAIMLLLSSKTSFTVEDDTSRLLDAGRFAIENISRSVRQTGYENLESEKVPIVSLATDPPNIRGVDDATLPLTSGPPPAPTTLVNHHSDILYLQYFGAADGTVVNCAGIAVPTPLDVPGSSVYFVRQIANDEPELHCGYSDAAGNFTSTALVSGVESFQVLYGIDTTNDGIPDRFLSATELINLAPASAADNWKKVVAVKVALLMRGARTQRADAQNETYQLFGAPYSSTSDPGSTFSEADPSLPATERSRTRKVFSTTIQLRNRTAGGNMAPLS